MKLDIELIPQTAWRQNLRKMLSKIEKQGFHPISLTKRSERTKL